MDDLFGFFVAEINLDKRLYKYMRVTLKTNMVVSMDVALSKETMLLVAFRICRVPYLSRYVFVAFHFSKFF